MLPRSSGILMHITSLPSPFGIGDFGLSGYRFVDFLAKTRQRYWQVLPLNSTSGETNHSPYSSYSGFGMNTLLISPEFMVRDGYLDGGELGIPPGEDVSRVDFPAVEQYKTRLFDRAFERFRHQDPTESFLLFCEENCQWLDDHALFIVLKSYYCDPIWSDWPVEVRDRHTDTLYGLRNDLEVAVKKEKFLQYLAYNQWLALKTYANNKGVKIIGDIPIYVADNSCDVWVSPDVFQLNDAKQPDMVAGLPPDYHNKDGQIWGNPLYNWDALQAQAYQWWLRRLVHVHQQTDLVRFDHFRGLDEYYAIPKGEKTGQNGKWKKAPIFDFIATVRTTLPSLQLIAEDLGENISPVVRKVMDRFQLPGMKVLQLGFSNYRGYSKHLPDNYPRNCVVYTGTHDFNTIQGWYQCEVNTHKECEERLAHYLGYRPDPKNIHWELIRIAMRSVASIVIIPMQDILGLDGSARMNTPSTTGGNWEWRYDPSQSTHDMEERLLLLTSTYGRDSETPA